MKPGLSLFLLASIYYSLASVVPYDSDQVVLSHDPLENTLQFGNGIKQSVLDLIEDGKKEILKGKVNMQKWLHAGKEYIKQDNLLCGLVS